MTAALFAVAGIVLSRIAPVLLMPIFYRFRPLDRDSLRERLMTLSRRAGVPVLGAFEWGLGEKTTRANAALVGVGQTRRILVSDTLLKDYTDDEIEVILAHEMAHHIHHDIWTALALETLIVAAALYSAHAAVTRFGGFTGAAGPGDLAALPVLILAAGLVSLVLRPIGNAWSRYNERRADRFALTLTRRPGRVHLGDAPPRRAESRRGASVRAGLLVLSHSSHYRRADCRGVAACRCGREPPARRT